MSIATLVATVGAGLFSGASTYVSVVEHPAWLESGPAVAVKGLGPSFRRAGVLQGGLASVSLVSAAVAWFQGSGLGWLVGGVLLGTLIPFTLVIIMPVNRRLLDPQLDPGSREAIELLRRWGRLHAVRTVIGVAVFVAFAGLLWAAEKQPSSPAPASVKVIPVEIPISNQIYVQARLNNSEPMWFILDTGATWTILDVDKAKELNIKSEGARSLEFGQAHPVTTSFAKDASLDISGVTVPVKTLAVMPAKLRHAPQIVGLIGSDLFKRFVVGIDYIAKTIELFEPNLYEYTGRGEVLPIEIIEDIPHIVVRISKGSIDSMSVRLLLDTGASQTILLYAPFVEKNRLLETTQGTIKLAAGGLGGGSFVRKGRANAVQVGKIVFEDPLVDFSIGRGAADRRDGIIGNGLLNRFKVIVDYSRKQAILEPTAQLDVPTDFDFFRIEIIRDGNTYRIGEMLQKSIAGSAGLKTERL